MSPGQTREWFEWMTSWGFSAAPPPRSYVTIFAHNAAAWTPSGFQRGPPQCQVLIKMVLFSLVHVPLITLCPSSSSHCCFCSFFLPPTVPCSGPTHRDGNPRQDHAVQEQDGGRGWPEAAAGLSGGVRGATWAHEETGLAFSATT